MDSERSGGRRDRENISIFPASWDTMGDYTISFVGKMDHVEDIMWMTTRGGTAWYDAELILLQCDPERCTVLSLVWWV